MNIRHYVPYGQTVQNPFLSQLFAEWDRVLRTYEDLYYCYDLPYVYGEQAQTFLLGLAAHNLGFHPLAEVSRRKKLKSARARLDLELQPSADVWWAIESKHWYGRIDQKGLNAELRERLRLACDAAAELTDAYTLKIGIVFARPFKGTRWPVDSELDEFRSTIEGIAEDSKSDRTFGVLHWCRRYVAKNSGHTGCPGIAILGRFV